MNFYNKDADIINVRATKKCDFYAESNSIQIRAKSSFHFRKTPSWPTILNIFKTNSLQLKNFVRLKKKKSSPTYFSTKSILEVIEIKLLTRNFTSKSKLIVGGKVRIMTKNFKLTSSIYKLKVTEVIYINMKTRRQKINVQSKSIQTNQYFVSFTSLICSAII